MALVPVLPRRWPTGPDEPLLRRYPVTMRAGRSSCRPLPPFPHTKNDDISRHHAGGTGCFRLAITTNVCPPLARSVGCFSGQAVNEQVEAEEEAALDVRPREGLGQRR